jgi:hypothetical protein
MAKQGNKRRASVLSENDETELKKLGKKKRALAVSGQPDQSDIDNLNRLFSEYEKAHPGRFRRMKQDYDTSQSLREKPTLPKGINSSELHMSFWLPQDLQQVMEQYWPTLWTNKAHVAWFVKHYPLFKA